MIHFEFIFLVLFLLRFQLILSKSDSKKALLAIVLTSESYVNWIEFIPSKPNNSSPISLMTYSRDLQVTDCGI